MILIPMPLVMPIISSRGLSPLPEWMDYILMGGLVFCIVLSIILIIALILCWMGY